MSVIKDRETLLVFFLYFLRTFCSERDFFIWWRWTLGEKKVRVLSSPPCSVCCPIWRGDNNKTQTKRAGIPFSPPQNQCMNSVTCNQNDIFVGHICFPLRLFLFIYKALRLGSPFLAILQTHWRVYKKSPPEFVDFIQGIEAI